MTANLVYKMEVKWNYPACLRCQRQLGTVQEMMWLPCFHDLVCGDCSCSLCDCSKGCPSPDYYYKSNELSQINRELWDPYNRHFGMRKRLSDYCVFVVKCLRARQDIPGLERVDVAAEQAEENLIKN